MSQNTNRKSGVERRREREVRDTREKKKIRLAAIIVVAVLVVMFCGALLINSTYIRRHSVAISVGDLKFSPAEVDFLFMSEYRSVANSMYEYYGEYAQNLLPVSGTPLKSQIYDPETGQTWADFIHDRVFQSVSQMASLCAEADRNGFVVPDELRTEMESAITALKETATMYGLSSLEQYLHDYFSPSVDENAVRHVYEINLKASAYAEHKRDSFTYSEQQLTDFYEENKDEFDVLTFRYMTVEPVEVKQDDYATDEEYEEAKAAAQAEAVERGKLMADAIKSEQDFISTAREYDAEAYALDDSTLRHYKGPEAKNTLGEEQAAWLLDPERKPGEAVALEDTTGCYVLYFIDRSKNEYNLVNLRQITITPADVSVEDYEGEEDPNFLAAIEKSKQDALAEAEAVLAAYELGGSQEDNFSQLYSKYSSEQNVEGGLYENVYMYSTESVAPAVAVNAWAFEPGRKAGDYEIVIAADGTAYFVLLSSVGEMYNTYLADDGMRTRDYTAWDEALTKPEVKKHWAFSLAL